MRATLPLLCGILLSLAANSGAGEPDAPTGESADLVRKLGDGDFRVREGAERELARRGAAALVEVKRGAADDDLEIRRRSQNLLAMLQKSDVDRLLSPFVAGKEDPKTPLPAWAALKKVMGDDASSRFLYALLYKSDLPFLEALEKDPKVSIAQLDARIRKMTPIYTGGLAARRTVPGAAIEEVASVLLIATTAPLDAGAANRVMALLSQPTVQTSVGWSHAVRKLTEKFLEQKCDDSPTGMQAARLAMIYGCHELIEKRFRPATQKLLESAAANPSDVNLFYRALNQARQYNMHDLVEVKLKPALLANVAKSAAGDSIDFIRLTQAVNMCQNVGGMEQDLKPVLRPALTQLVKKQAEQIDTDPSRMFQLVQLAQASQCRDLIDDVLRPAYRAKLMKMTPQQKEQGQLTTALHFAQQLGMQEEIDTILKPAATAIVQDASSHIDDLGRVQQAINVAQTFGLREGVRPLAQQMLDDVAKPKSTPDVARITAALQLVRMSDLPNVNEAIDRKLKPAARQALLAGESQPANSTTVPQAISLAEQLQLKEGVSFALKAAASKSLVSYVRGQALMYVAKFGDKSAIPQLEAILDDTTDLGSAGINNVTIRTQVGDMALGALIHVSGQKIEDYKLPWTRAVAGGGGFIVPGGNRQVLPGATYYGFDTDAARQEARKKWRESQAK